MQDKVLEAADEDRHADMEKCMLALRIITIIVESTIACIVVVGMKFPRFGSALFYLVMIDVACQNGLLSSVQGNEELRD